MKSWQILGLLGLCAGCGGPAFTGNGVALSVHADPSFAGTIATLELSVSGADSDSLTFPVSDQLAATQVEEILYRAHVSTGDVQLSVVAHAAGGEDLGVGQTTATLKADAMVSAMLTLQAPGGDAAMPPDLATPPDLAPVAITPSHVSPDRYQAGAASLQDVVGIDTTNLQLQFATGSGFDGGAFGPAPAGVAFAVDSGFAVLSVGEWLVNKEIRVTGNKALVVVAAGKVVIDNIIHGEAVGATPGPGGAGPGLGMGAGVPGNTASANGYTKSGGGGGAGFATTGAPGGTGGTFFFCIFPPCASPPPDQPGGVGGPVYGDVLTDFLTGSGGGRGGACGGQNGGAGGGAIQISSGSTIFVEFEGGINVGGGAGGSDSGCAAGGGGSGGTIFLEGRGVEVHGWLAANGGGGGGIGAAQDGLLSPAQANNGGTGFFGPPVAGPSGGANGNAPVIGLSYLGFVGPGGGGGGATGNIWLRTANVPAVQQASVISPAPQTDTTLQ
jgi:hypothetical protein